MQPPLCHLILLILYFIDLCQIRVCVHIIWFIGTHVRYKHDSSINHDPYIEVNILWHCVAYLCRTKVCSPKICVASWFAKIVYSVWWGRGRDGKRPYESCVYIIIIIIICDGSPITLGRCDQTWGISTYLYMYTHTPLSSTLT